MRTARGFTLIELLVVMALIGLLLSISMPKYFRNLEKARETVLRQDLAQLRDAIDKYFGDMGCYPESLDELVSKKYIRKIPVDPMTNKVDSWIVIAPQGGDAGRVFDVTSGSHEHAHDGSTYATW